MFSDLVENLREASDLVITREEACFLAQLIMDSMEGYAETEAEMTACKDIILALETGNEITIV